MNYMCARDTYCRPIRVSALFPDDMKVKISGLHAISCLICSAALASLILYSHMFSELNHIKHRACNNLQYAVLFGSVVGPGQAENNRDDQPILSAYSYSIGREMQCYKKEKTAMYSMTRG